MRPSCCETLCILSSDPDRSPHRGTQNPHVETSRTATESSVRQKNENCLNARAHPGENRSQTHPEQVQCSRRHAPKHAACSLVSRNRQPERPTQRPPTYM